MESEKKTDHDLLIRIDEKITAFSDSFHKHIIDDNIFSKEVTEKIGSLERWRWQIVGATGIIIVAIETVTRLFLK